MFSITPRHLIKAILFSAALVGTVRAEETLWIEAEHLHGVRGYCWPGGPNPKTDGHWGISGPGWAAEWTQGGESNFMSIACGPDDRLHRKRSAPGRGLSPVGALSR